MARVATRSEAEAGTTRRRRRAVEDDIGPRLRRHREERQLSLRELARRLGISPSAISQFETGKSRLSVSTLYAIVTELGNPRSYPWLRHAMFYLPEYSMFELRVGDRPPGYYAPQLASEMLPQPDSEVRLPARTRRLVWFVDHWSPLVARPPGLIEIELPYGRFLYVLPIDRRIAAGRG